jgi:2-amino-4-hydroxy-6-hydroxymethyldihydropteridine diphosphokinase
MVPPECPITPGSPEAVCRAWIGLGANLGDRQVTLEQAVLAIQALPESRVVGCSRWWRSAPLDAQGPEFLNGVIALDTSLAPLALLDQLQAIERQHGRERPYPNAPRTLDLDLLLYGEETRNTPRLQLPHPRVHQRAFVLGPLLELDPQLMIPGRGSAHALLCALPDQDCRPWADPARLVS